VSAEVRAGPLLAEFYGIIIAGVLSFPKLNAALFSVWLFAAANLFAHGDLHPRIVEITEQIARAPTNALLYFERADLYRQDGDFTNALKDLNMVAQLDRTLKRVDFMRGQTQLDANQPQAALTPLNRYLADKPPDGEAYALRARVLAKVGRPAPAIADYTDAIAFSTVPNPELYIERAAQWRALGKQEEAIRGLDEGIRKIGAIVTLELPAVDAELALKRTDAALARIDRVMARLQRKETWFVRRAEILRDAGREEEAKKNYRDALEAIEKLPPAHRTTRMTLDLEARIRTAMTNTAVQAQQPPAPPGISRTP
jgi:tetratricopeptide (TPR) repeat protein